MKHSPFILLSLLFIFSFLEAKEAEMFSRTQVIMGTFCTLSLEKSQAAALSQGFMNLKKTEAVLSSYAHDALVFKLNRDKQIQTDPMLKDILEKSLFYYQETEGYFDITIGSITKKLYHFGEKEQIPSAKALSLAPLGVGNIRIHTKSIFLENNITLDLGGIGKGYGVDVLAKYYQSKGIKKGQIALSGDIRCLNLCRIAIQDPFHEDAIIATFHARVPQLSISTSGTYRRFVQTQEQHHLINPKRKTQGRDFVSVTIVSQANNTLCDAMATAIATMPKAFALQFVKEQNDFGYLLITTKGEEISGNLEKFVQREKREERKK